MNQRPVLLKGPVESKHKHKAVNSNLRDARKMVTCDYREDISKIESINRCLKKDVPAQIESSSVSQMKQAKLEEVRQSNGLERIRLVVDKETSEPVASKIDNATRSARLIGKRLCIDGYIYKTRSYASGKIYWDCQNMYSRLCKAKAITSNPIADNNKFVVYKGIESSKHNHPASFAQVERAEEVAKISRKICSRRRRFKPKLTNQTSKTPKRENGSLQPNCSRSSNATRVDGKMLRKSSRSAASNASERSLAARNYWKIRRKGLLKNDVMYRQFLVKFLERPIFDRKNVTEALQVIYTSPGGCSIAYATVLENREKIERDLQSLRSNSNAEITSLDSGSFNISQNAVVQSVVADIDTHKYTECDNSIAVEINDVTANQENAKPTVGESRQEVLGTCTTRLEVPTEGSRPQVSSPPRQESELNNTATSVPETQNATNLSSSVPIPTTTDQDDLQPKREAVVIDLTDDLDDIKVELKSSASGENSMQPNPIAQPASTWKTPVPFTPNFGLPREPNTFGLNPQNYYPFTMPPHYWYPVNNCSPEYNPLLNWTMQNSTGYNFNMENPNVPYLNAQNPYIPNVNAQNFNGSVNIAQAQWFSNVSNMKNGVAVNGEQFHAQTEPHQRPY